MVINHLLTGMILQIVPSDIHAPSIFMLSMKALVRSQRQQERRLLSLEDFNQALPGKGNIPTKFMYGIFFYLHLP